MNAFTCSTFAAIRNDPFLFVPGVRASVCHSASAHQLDKSLCFGHGLDALRSSPGSAQSGGRLGAERKSIVYFNKQGARCPRRQRVISSIDGSSRFYLRSEPALDWLYGGGLSWPSSGPLRDKLPFLGKMVFLG